MGLLEVSVDCKKLVRISIDALGGIPLRGTLVGVG